MDKAAEKINELKKEIEKLYLEKDNIEDNLEFKTDERKKIYQSNVKQLQKNLDLNDKKAEIEYKQANLKKLKKQMIGFTTFLILFCEAFLIAGSFMNLNTVIAIVTTIIGSAINISGGIFLGDIVGYRKTKKYLKDNHLENIENEILSNNICLKNTESKINEIKLEINKLLNDKDKILNDIDIKEEEIKKIESIRNKVINEYILNNKRLEGFINREYKKEIEPKEKTKIKKR